VAKDKPYYPHHPIGSVESLAKCLGLPPRLLKDLSEDTSSSYTEFSIRSKSGKERIVYDPKFELKRLQKRINSRLFEGVFYPSYLQGGIRDQKNPRDYIVNGTIHAGSKNLIGIDIKDFYNNIKEESVKPIFTRLFNFPDAVASILTKLVTRDGTVPQGACTSSYVANLVFFNSEYSLVSRMRARGFSYTRLLDDVTLSSKRPITKEESTELIKEVAAIFKKHNLRLNNKKTKQESAGDVKAEYKVTGVWVGHGIPKLRKAERRHIRHLVYICEKEYLKCRFSEEYHALWNRISGQVAKLTRLKHSQAEDLRLRMSAILPEYDNQMKASIIFEADKLLQKPVAHHVRPGVISSLNKTLYSLGVLTRTDKPLARHYKKMLRLRFINAPTKSEMWG